MDIGFFQELSFLIIGISLAVFFILDGFDLGVAMLNPFWTRKAERRAGAVHSIWPVWDGNELWGLASAIMLLASFPKAFTLLLPAFYPFVILLVLAVVYRPIAFELWFHNEKSRRFWQGALALSSFGIAFLVGVVVGNTIWGLELSSGQRFAGSLVSLLNPFSLLTGFVFVTLCLQHGAAWLVLKSDEESSTEARLAYTRTWVLSLTLSLAWSVFLAIAIPQAAGKPAVWIFICLLLSSLVAGRVAIGRVGRGIPGSSPRESAMSERLAGSNRGPVRAVFPLSVLTMASTWLLIGATQFPILVRSRGDGTLSLDISNASTSFASLKFLGIAVPVVLLVVAAYSIFVYRVFKGKMKADGAHY